MILTIVILALFALFWVAELVSHVTHYLYGPTLSALIWHWERQAKLNILRHVVIGMLVAILFTHLEFQTP